MTAGDKLQKNIDDAVALANIEEDILGAKSVITIHVLGLLIKKLSDTVDDLMEGIAEGANGKKFAVTLKDALTEAVSEFAKINKAIEFHPTVNVDMKPLQLIATDISKQNDSLILLLNKLLTGDGGKSDELHRLIVAMISRQNIFLEKGFQQFDYTKQLNTISEKIGKERVEDLVVKRNELREITNVVPIYKK